LLVGAALVPLADELISGCWQKQQSATALSGPSLVRALRHCNVFDTRTDDPAPTTTHLPQQLFDFAENVGALLSVLLQFCRCATTITAPTHGAATVS